MKKKALLISNYLTRSEEKEKFKRDLSKEYDITEVEYDGDLDTFFEKVGYMEDTMSFDNIIAIGEDAALALACDVYHEVILINPQANDIDDTLRMLNNYVFSSKQDCAVFYQTTPITILKTQDFDPENFNSITKTFSVITVKTIKNS